MLNNPPTLDVAPDELWGEAGADNLTATTADDAIWAVVDQLEAPLAGQQVEVVKYRPLRLRIAECDVDGVIGVMLEHLLSKCADDEDPPETKDVPPEVRAQVRAAFEAVEAWYPTTTYTPVVPQERVVADAQQWALRHEPEWANK